MPHQPIKALAVIPARFASSRFPGKVLASIAGKSMLAHVVDRALEAAVFDSVIVATDDDQVFDAMTARGIAVEMTAVEHPSGTDRVWEVAQRVVASGVSYDVVFNIQADEPFLPSEYLRLLYDALCADRDAETDVMTLMCPFSSLEQWQDPNVVKALPVAMPVEGLAPLRYFSRATIPFDRDGQVRSVSDLLPLVYRHIGVYAYRYEALAKFIALPEHPLERLERLEQLRGLGHGLRYTGCVVEKAPIGVDTPEDLQALAGEISHK